MENNIAVYSTATKGGKTATAISAAGVGLGYESGEVAPDGDVQFVDYPFTKPSVGYDQHLAAVKQHRPELTVAPDIEDGRTLSTVVEQADELAQYADTVIVVPKSVEPSEVPDRFRVGLPLADYGSDSPWEIADFIGVGDVHVLGGPPDAQRHVVRSYVDVASVDGASVIRAANFYSVWRWPDGWTEAPESDYYERVTASLKNLKAALNGEEASTLPTDLPLSASTETPTVAEPAVSDSRGPPPCQSPNCSQRAVMDPTEGRVYCADCLTAREWQDDYQQQTQAVRTAADALPVKQAVTDGGTPTEHMDTDRIIDDIEQYEKIGGMRLIEVARKNQTNDVDEWFRLLESEGEGHVRKMALKAHLKKEYGLNNTASRYLSKEYTDTEEIADAVRNADDVTDLKGVGEASADDVTDAFADGGGVSTSGAITAGLPAEWQRNGSDEVSYRVEHVEDDTVSIVVTDESTGYVVRARETGLERRVGFAPNFEGAKAILEDHARTFTNVRAARGYVRENDMDQYGIQERQTIDNTDGENVPYSVGNRPVRRRLAENFASLEELKEATDDHLRSFEGVGSTTIQNLRDELGGPHANTDEEKAEQADVSISEGNEPVIEPSGLSRDDPATELSGVGPSSTLAEANETVGDFFDMGCPFHEGAKQYSHKALKQILGADFVDLSKPSHVIRVFAGYTAGKNFDKDGNEVGNYPEAQFQMFDWADVSWSWAWDKTPGNDLAAGTDIVGQQAAIGSGDRLPVEVLDYDPEEDTGLSGIHLAESAELVVEDNTEYVKYSADLSDVDFDVENESVYVPYDTVELYSLLFNHDYSKPGLNSDAGVQLVVDTTDNIGPTRRDQQWAAIFRAPNADLFGLAEGGMLAEPWDFDLEADDDFQAWAETVAAELEAAEREYRIPERARMGVAPDDQLRDETGLAFLSDGSEIRRSDAEPSPEQLEAEANEFGEIYDPSLEGDRDRTYSKRWFDAGPHHKVALPDQIGDWELAFQVGEGRPVYKKDVTAENGAQLRINKGYSTDVIHRRYYVEHRKAGLMETGISERETVAEGLSPQEAFDALEAAALERSDNDTSDMVVITSPYRPIPRDAYKWLKNEYVPVEDLDAESWDAYSRLAVPERPPQDFLDRYELEVEREPTVVWDTGSGEASVYTDDGHPDKVFSEGVESDGIGPVEAAQEAERQGWEVVEGDPANISGYEPGGEPVDDTINVSATPWGFSIARTAVNRADSLFNSNARYSNVKGALSRGISGDTEAIDGDAESMRKAIQEADEQTIRMDPEDAELVVEALVDYRDVTPEGEYSIMGDNDATRAQIEDALSGFQAAGIEIPAASDPEPAEDAGHDFDAEPPEEVAGYTLSENGEDEVSWQGRNGGSPKSSILATGDWRSELTLLNHGGRYSYRWTLRVKHTVPDDDDDSYTRVIRQFKYQGTEGPEAGKKANRGKGIKRAVEWMKEHPADDEPATTEAASQPLDDLDGIGPATADKLEALGVSTVADAEEAYSERVSTSDKWRDTIQTLPSKKARESLISAVGGDPEATAAEDHRQGVLDKARENEVDGRPSVGNYVQLHFEDGGSVLGSVTRSTDDSALIRVNADSEPREWDYIGERYDSATGWEDVAVAELIEEDSDRISEQYNEQKLDQQPEMEMPDNDTLRDAIAARGINQITAQHLAENHDSLQDVEQHVSTVDDVTELTGVGEASAAQVREVFESAYVGDDGDDGDEYKGQFKNKRMENAHYWAAQARSVMDDNNDPTDWYYVQIRAGRPVIAAKKDKATEQTRRDVRYNLMDFGFDGDQVPAANWNELDDEWRLFIEPTDERLTTAPSDWKEFEDGDGFEYDEGPGRDRLLEYLLDNGGQARIPEITGHFRNADADHWYDNLVDEGYVDKTVADGVFYSINDYGMDSFGPDEPAEPEPEPTEWTGDIEEAREKRAAIEAARETDPDDELSGPALRALKKNWGVYKAGLSAGRDAAEEVEQYKDLRDDAEEAAAIINDIRAAHGQGPIDFDGVDAIPDVDAVGGEISGDDPGVDLEFSWSAEGRAADPYDPTKEAL